MTEFTPFASTLGGVLIGLSAALLLWSHGKMAGISGIVGGLLVSPLSRGSAWRIAFLLGLVLTGPAIALVSAGAFENSVTRSSAALLGAGLLVGFGTRLGNGCTSGHGVCGISRLSVRSVVATAVFTLLGAVSVFFVQRFAGGAL
jgi:uncharacterized membrane protein YedE/YeeE